ncbi:MAG: sigma-70 family RNA polymerase sigma factor [Bacteroidota bacterium]|nr:sigma-70 family RNA polymerase sigma factor [Bacteroidota bacterium]MDP3145627.1 sigma-70 family RNA polymerase sigma factor [Bacteroidota bacterium]MDP3558700.1 sigma-70 family RNA polymerase sigma factor [Bacteroidota bacterium]
MSDTKKYSNLSDTDLINTFLEKEDNNIVGILYERYGHLVLGLCIKYLKNKDEAQDAVIQIFTGLLKDLKKHKVEFFKSWLYVYSKNFCLMELRKRQSMLKKELELKDNVHLIMDFSTPEHLNEKEKQITIMEQALELLNIDQKKCIDLFYLKNKSYVEIVDITGYTANEVKSHIQNGKRNLKLKMEILINEDPNK